MKPGAETPDPNEPAPDLDGEVPEGAPVPPVLTTALPPRFSAQSLVGSPVPAVPGQDRLRVTPPGTQQRSPTTLPGSPTTPRVGFPVRAAPLESGAVPGPAAILCPRCREESPAGAEFCERCGLSFLETGAIEGSAPAAPGAAALVGQTINGKYRVLSVLGEGGFGVVYKVELLLFDRANIFALKLLHPTLSQDRSFRRRFLREAGLALTLIHENTIQIREFGQMDDGHLFFTMDYCEGEPLKAVVEREEFLSVPRALHIVRQILSVLKHAHARGILHRDLKPENIFLEKSPGKDFVKVGDFGLAKSFEPASGVGTPRGRVQRPVPPGDEDITRGGIVGTPRYMSPEQAMGKEDLDQRSDLYAVGVILYEMLYGNVPPERAMPSGVVSVPLKTPASLPGHAVPRDVWVVVRRALEVRREDRFQSADEFLEALDSLPSYTPAYIGRARSRSRTGVWLGRGAAIAGVVGLVWLSGKVLTSPPGDRTVDPQGQAPSQEAAAASPGVKGVASQGAPYSQDPAAGYSHDPARRGAELETKARPVEPPRLSPFPREGILAFVRLTEGDVLRYECYREGMVPDRELVYTVTAIPKPGEYTLRVTPGERTVTWQVDESASELIQKFTLPDPETGELTKPGERLLLKLPGPDAVVEGEYMEKGLRVHAHRVDVSPPPGHPRGEAFTRCLRVESWEEGRAHYHYFKEGKGLVGVEVYERRPVPDTDGQPPRDPAPQGGAQPPAAGTTKGVSLNGKAHQDVLVYARYLVEG